MLAGWTGGIRRKYNNTSRNWELTTPSLTGDFPALMRQKEERWIRNVDIVAGQ
jgi:hypothetical protein